MVNMIIILLTDIQFNYSNVNIFYNDRYNL